MSGDLDFLKIHLMCASKGMYFGSHKPMNEFSTQLLKVPWLGKLNFAGYSSSRVDFEIEDDFIRSISVYKSFQSILERFEERVTVCIRPVNNIDISYTKENLSIKNAINLIEEIINHNDETFNKDNISIIEVEEKLLVIIKDGWFCYNEIKETIDKIVNISIGRIRNYYLIIQNIDHLSLDYLIEISSLKERFRNEINNIDVCCDRRIMNEYFDYFEKDGSNINFKMFIDILKIQDDTILIQPIAGFFDGSNRTFLEKCISSTIQPDIKKIIFSFKYLESTRGSSVWAKLLEMTKYLEDIQIKLIIKDLTKVHRTILVTLGMNSKLIVEPPIADSET